MFIHNMNKQAAEICKQINVAKFQLLESDTQLTEVDGKISVDYYYISCKTLDQFAKE